MDSQPENVNKLLHDLRNGLAAIRLNAQYIEKIAASGTVNDGTVQERAKKILNNIDRVAAQIDAVQGVHNPQNAG